MKLTLLLQKVRHLFRDKRIGRKGLAQTYHLWFSPTQQEVMRQQDISEGKLPMDVFYRCGLKTVLITCVSATKNHGTYFKDIKYLGKGRYSHRQVAKSFLELMAEYILENRKNPQEIEPHE